MNQNSDSFDSLLPSKFIKKEDVTPPVVLTISGYGTITLMNKKTGADEEAPTLMFEETPKTIVYKAWTSDALKEIFPAGRSASIGQKVELFVDPSVKMEGRKVGGVRIRAVQGKAAPF
jgi:hypothetical protein